MSSFSSRSGAALLLAALALAPLVGAEARGGETYFSLSLNELEITEGRLPEPRYAAWHVRPLTGRDALFLPVVLLDGPGEAHLVDLRGAGVWKILFAARVPHAGDVTGRLIVPGIRGERRTDVRFRVPAGRGSKDPTAFGKAMELRCHYLANLAIPGAAWFRWSARDIFVERAPRAAREHEGLDATLALFTGARALAEHLQLDRFLSATHRDKETVPLEDIPGITVPAHAWQEGAGEPPPAADPLARLIPADQHAILLPSFQALLDLIDEAHRTGTPILRLLEQAAIETDARGRYERQLCLEPDELARALGPALVDSVAVTGSDPYYRTGSDVAVLFESRNVDALYAWLEARQRAAAAAVRGAETLSGETGGLSWVAVRTPDRALCSYLARHENAVLVTNSPAQLDALAAVLAGSRPSLQSLPEYRFFRARYPRASQGETALFLLTDATIRRWLGPRWRISASRRIRAAAALAHARARQVEELGLAAAAAPAADAALAAEYGNLAFITPIAELSVECATLEEERAYKRFRAAYERQWRTVFDPIAVRLSLRARGFDSDVTVMPLSLHSELQEYRRLCGSASIEAGAGDPHPGTVLHFAQAGFSSLSATPALGLLADRIPPVGPLQPLCTRILLANQSYDWLGDSVSLYLDADPLWTEFGRAPDLWEFIDENVSRLPVAVTLEVKDAQGAARFLGVARDLWQRWDGRAFHTDTVTWRGIEAVRLTETAELRHERVALDDWSPLTLYCALLPGRLLITPCEAVLHSAIDRALAPAQGDVLPWQGQSVALRLERGALDAIQAYFGEWQEEERQAASWRNLPILNEWRRLFPGQDPVEAHARLFGEELVCPGGGEYVWSAAWRTMESTAYGCPIAPRQEPRLPSMIDTIATVEAGITFEGDGLRARLRFERR